MPALYIRDNNQNTKSYSIANTSTPNYPYVRVNGSYVYLKPKPAEEMNLVMRTVTNNVDHQTSTYTVSTSSGSSYFTTASSTGNMSSITASTRVSSYTISEYTQRTTTATSYQTVRSTTATEYYTRASTYDTSYFVRISTYDTSYMTKASVYGYSGATTSGGFMFSYDDVDYFTEEQGYTDNRGKSQTWTAVWECGPFAKPAGYGSYTLEEYDYEVTYGTTKQNQYNYSETTKGRDRRFTDIVHPKGYRTLTYTSQFILGYVTSFSVTGPYGAGRTYRVQTGPLQTVNGTLKYSTTGREYSYKSSEKYSGTVGTSWYDSYTTSYYTRFSVDNAVTGYTTSLYSVGLLSTTALTRSSTYRTIYYTRLSTSATSYATRQSTSATSYRDRISTTNTVYVTDRATTSVDSSTRASLIWYSGYSSHTYSTSLSSADTYTTTFPEYVPMIFSSSSEQSTYWTGRSCTSTEWTTYSTGRDYFTRAKTTSTIYYTRAKTTGWDYYTRAKTTGWDYYTRAKTTGWDYYTRAKTTNTIYDTMYANSVYASGYMSGAYRATYITIKGLFTSSSFRAGYYTFSMRGSSLSSTYVSVSMGTPQYNTSYLTNTALVLAQNVSTWANISKITTNAQYQTAPETYSQSPRTAPETYSQKARTAPETYSQSPRTAPETYSISYKTGSETYSSSWRTTKDTRFYWYWGGDPYQHHYTASAMTIYPSKLSLTKNEQSGNNWVTQYNQVDSFTTSAETTTWI